jgi:hypothetical protein
MRRFTVAVFLIMLFPALFLGAETIDPFVLPQARFAGLGGNHVAVGDNFYSLFTNPASFVDIEEEFSAAEVSISAYGPVLELIDLFRKDSDSLDLTGIVGPAGFAAGLDVGGPLALGWVGRGLGLGIFDRLRSTAAVSGTKIRPLVAGEILLVGGYSFKLIEKESHRLDAGFLGKGFFRGDLDLEAPIIEAEDILDDFSDKPFGTYLGLGIDLGFRYTFRENLSAAIVCFDAYSPVLVTPYDSFSDFTGGGSSSSGSSHATVKRRLDLGMKYRIRSEFIDRYISRMTIMADYRDILDFTALIPRNPILNIGIGLELTVLNSLSFRVGISDALPSFGLGLDFSAMTLDFAIRGKELGLDPGIQSVYGIDLSLLFRY